MSLRHEGWSASSWALFAAILFLGFGGLWGGAALVTDPAGGLLQMPPGLLQGTPFRDFRVPGVVLLLVFGMLPLAVARGLWTGRPWSRPGALFVGFALLGWVVVQVALIGHQHAAQPLYGVLGLAILVLAAVQMRIEDARRVKGPASYVFFLLEEVTDQGKYAEYSRRVDAVVVAHGGRYLAVDPRPDLVEGNGPLVKAVLLRFPSEEAARGWYDSPEYRPLAELRLAGARGVLVLVHGAAGADAE